MPRINRPPGDNGKNGKLGKNGAPPPIPEFLKKKQNEPPADEYKPKQFADQIVTLYKERGLDVPESVENSVLSQVNELEQEIKDGRLTSAEANQKLQNLVEEARDIIIAENAPDVPVAPEAASAEPAAPEAPVVGKGRLSDELPPEAPEVAPVPATLPGADNIAEVKPPQNPPTLPGADTPPNFMLDLGDLDFDASVMSQSPAEPAVLRPMRSQGPTRVVPMADPTWRFEPTLGTSEPQVIRKNIRGAEVVPEPTFPPLEMAKIDFLKTRIHELDGVEAVRDLTTDEFAERANMELELDDLYGSTTPVAGAPGHIEPVPGTPLSDEDLDDKRRNQEPQFGPSGERIEPSEGAPMDRGHKLNLLNSRLSGEASRTIDGVGPSGENLRVPDGTPAEWRKKLTSLITEAYGKTKEVVSGGFTKSVDFLKGAGAGLDTRIGQLVGNGGSEKLKKSKEFLVQRAKVAGEKVKKYGPGVEEWFRQQGESYNKVPKWQKILLGASLGVGAALTAGVPTYIYAGAIVYQRAKGMAGMYTHFDDSFQKRFSGNAEWTNKLLAGGAAVLYTAAISGGMKYGIEYAKDSGLAEGVQNWLRDHWPFNSSPATNATADSPARVAAPEVKSAAPASTTEGVAPAETKPTQNISTAEVAASSGVASEVTGEQMVMGGPETPDIRPIPPEGIPLAQDISTEDWSGPPPGEVEAVDRQDVTPGTADVQPPQEAAPVESGGVLREGEYLVSRAETYAGRLEDATEYLKKNPEAHIWIEAEKPQVGPDGISRPYMIELQFKPGFLGFGGQVVEVPQTEIPPDHTTT